MPECLNLSVKHLLKIMIWCCKVHSEVGLCRWNCQCDQMQRYTAEMHGAISICAIPVFVMFEGLQRTMSLCQTGHRLEVRKQHQDADLACTITGYESD